MALTPKGCHVRRITLDGRGKAELRLGCGGEYRSVNAKAREVNFRGSYVTGAAELSFVLSPAHAVCSKGGGPGRITCKLVGDTSQDSLRGAKRRRRKR